MKVAQLIARILLGLVFVVFGLNGFMQFLPQPAMPERAGAFFGALAATGYFIPLLFTAQLLGGGLLLFGMVPLGLVILAPVIVNIVAFHIFLAPDGLPVAVIVAALELFLIWAYRDAFRPLISLNQPVAVRGAGQRN